MEVKQLLKFEILMPVALLTFTGIYLMQGKAICSDSSQCSYGEACTPVMGPFPVAASNENHEFSDNDPNHMINGYKIEFTQDGVVVNNKSYMADYGSLNNIPYSIININEHRYGICTKDDLYVRPKKKCGFMDSSDKQKNYKLYITNGKVETRCVF